MKRIRRGWALEHSNGRLMTTAYGGIEVYSKKSLAVKVAEAIKKGKPVKVRITVEKVI